MLLWTTLWRAWWHETSKLCVLGSLQRSVANPFHLLPPPLGPSPCPYNPSHHPPFEALHQSTHAYSLLCYSTHCILVLQVLSLASLTILKPGMQAILLGGSSATDGQKQQSHGPALLILLVSWLLWRVVVAAKKTRMPCSC